MNKHSIALRKIVRNQGMENNIQYEITSKHENVNQPELITPLPLSLRMTLGLPCNTTFWLFPFPQGSVLNLDLLLGLVD